MKALFRADASPAMGGGHVMRCLTLADELGRNGWTCAFAVCGQALDTVPALERSQHQVKVLMDADLFCAEALCGLAPDGVDLLVIDHYGIGADYESTCRAVARKVLVIDDLANRAHICDVLLDQTFGRVPDEYTGLVPDDCRVLVGTEYALLRPQFAEWRQRSLLRRKNANSPARILVSLGMTDPDNITIEVLGCIAVNGLQVTVDVLLGPSAPYINQVRERARDMATMVHVHVGMDDVAPLLAETDLAIGAGGSASWERCCLGVPSLVIAFAENQQRVAKELAATGAIVLADANEEMRVRSITQLLKTLASDPDRTYELSQRAAGICDGRGVNRLHLVLEPICTSDGQVVSLRRINEDDAGQLLEWQRHPCARQYARNPRVPGLSEHRAWFCRKMVESENYTAIIECNDYAVGMLRLDIIDPKETKDPMPSTFEVSILVAHNYSNKGIAYSALMYARRLFPEVRMNAYIHADNVASQRVFLKAGFVKLKEKYVSFPIVEKVH